MYDITTDKLEGFNASIEPPKKVDPYWEIKVLAANEALKELFSKSYFDICIVRSILKVLDKVGKEPHMTILATLHCVDYAKMEPALRKAIPGMISDLIGSDFKLTVEDVLNGIHDFEGRDITPRSLYKETTDGKKSSSQKSQETRQGFSGSKEKSDASDPNAKGRRFRLPWSGKKG